MIIETARLRLRRPVAADAEALFDAYARDAEVTRYLAWPRHRTLEDTLSFIQFSDQEWARRPPGPLLIESREDGRLLGSTGIQLETTSSGSTGYVLRRDAWGKGYATEALRAMADLAPKLGLKELHSLCHPDHTASQHVMKKCGFVQDGLLKEFAVFPNLAPDRKVDTLRFVLKFE